MFVDSLTRQQRSTSLSSFFYTTTTFGEVESTITGLEK